MKNEIERATSTDFPEIVPAFRQADSHSDEYDTLVSVRPPKAMSHEKALEMIIEGAGAHFDPFLINNLHDTIDDFIHVDAEIREPMPKRE